MLSKDPRIIFQSEDLCLALMIANAQYGFPLALFDCVMSPLELINPKLYVQVLELENCIPFTAETAQALGAILMNFLIDQGFNQCEEVNLLIHTIRYQEPQDTAKTLIAEIVWKIFTAAYCNLDPVPSSFYPGQSTYIYEIKLAKGQTQLAQSTLCIAYEFLARAYSGGVRDLVECAYAMLNCGMPVNSIISQLRSLNSRFNS